MDFTKFITEQALILIPVLYVVGMFLKSTEKISDKYIPTILLVVGVIGANALLGVSVNSTIQGVLVAGTSVFANQIIKQIGKE